MVVRRLTPGISSAEVERIVRTAYRAARRRGGEVTVIFTGDAEMRRLNRRFRRRDKTTDVLSFPVGQAFPGPRADSIGDIVISLVEARRESRRRGVSLRDELRLLVVHGVLHCLGYDHETVRDARRMFALQARILVKLGTDARPTGPDDFFP